MSIEAEKYLEQCIGELTKVLDNHQCGLSIDETNGCLIISYEYKGSDGKDYILAKRAFYADIE